MLVLLIHNYKKYIHYLNIICYSVTKYLIFQQKDYVVIIQMFEVID